MAKKKKKPTVYYQVSRRIYGLLMIVAGWLVLAAVCFFSPADSSFNLATDKVSHFFGYPGANTAAVILTFSGLALPVFVLPVMVWGYKFCRLQEIRYFWLHCVVWLLGMVAAMICFDFIRFAAPLGGVVGRMLNARLLEVLPPFPYRRETVAATAGLLAVVAFSYTVDVSAVQWYRGAKKLLTVIWRGIRLIGKALAVLPVLIRRSLPQSAMQPGAGSNKKERREPKLKTETVTDDKTTLPVEKSPAAKPLRPVKKAAVPDDGYHYPDVSLLTAPKVKSGNTTVSEKELQKIAQDLEGVLQEFGINGKIVKIRPGPVVTLYELEPAPGTKTARVIGLADDIARSMSAVSVRIAVVAGSNTIGIELPNTTREIVWLRELFEGEGFQDSKNALNVVLGKDIGGENVYADLAKMPHLLVAGTTGSGKSVGMNSMILSLLYRMRPDECKLIMIDPKMLEFSVYNGIPHLLTPVITDPAKAVLGLKWAVKEMEDRYRAMAQLNVRNISGYNKKLEELRNSGERCVRTVQTGFDASTGAPLYEEQELDLTPLPYIVVVVDEMADLMLVAGKEVEAAIQRLAQMARAAGIHLILSTQRPSVDVITGVIKANFPTRISFQVTSKIDSRTILGEQGAEQLLGMGDMLYMPAGQRPIRVHGSFVKDQEVEKIVEYLKAQKEPEYVEGVTEGELNVKDSGAVFDKTAMGGSDDDLYNQAVAIVRNDKKTSISYVQRRLRIGYNRAAVLIERMEEEGVLSAADHSGKREIL